jgi:hypothetical protein
MPDTEPSPSPAKQTTAGSKVLALLDRGRGMGIWLLILLPVVGLFGLMRDHLVNIPYLDDFMFQPMFEKAVNGFEFTMAKSDHHLTIHDFFMVQMEHRMAFVRAVIMLRHHFSPADITPENWFTFALLVLTAVNVGLLLKKTAGAPFSRWWPVLALAMAVIFSPIQYQIVLWAMMFQVAMPAWSLTTMLVVLMSDRLPLWAKWLIGIVAALFATLSFAAGILVWLLPLPVMIWGSGFARQRERWMFLVCWLAGFAVTMALYFHDLHNEVDGVFAYKQGEVETMDQNMGAFFKDPVKSAIFILHLTGGHLGRGWQVSIMSLALGVGFISVASLMAACVYLLRRFDDKDLRQRLLPWICFGSYTPAAASLVAMGRIWATSSGNNAISPRYTIHGVPLSVSLLAIGFIMAKHLSDQHPQRRIALEKWCIGASVAVLALVSASWLHGMRMMETWESARLRMATNTMFYDLEDIGTDGNIAPNRNRARAMNSLGLLERKMTRSKELAQFKQGLAPLRESTAKWESLIISAEDDLCEATGYACLRNRRRPADGIFLTYKDKSNHDKWTIFHVAQVEALPLFLGQTIGRDMQNIQIPGTFMEGTPVCGFNAIFLLSQLPKEPDLELAAWAFDYREETAYAMIGRFRLDALTKTVRPMDKPSVKLKGSKK